MIRSLLIGCGNIGYNYDMMSPQNTQTHFRALYNDKRFNLISTVDENVEKQLKIKNEYGIDCVKSLSQIDLHILKNIDLIVISTSERSKIEILSHITKLGLEPKAILYEKPIATSATELKSFFDCFKSLKSELRFNFMRRADPSYKWLRKNFERVTGVDQQLKVLINFSGDLHNSLSHGLDFLLGLLGSAKFKKLQISALDNIWLIKNEYFDLTIQRTEINVNIFDVTIFSEKAKINYSHTDEKLTITEVGRWYDFEGNFFTMSNDSLDFNASNYMSFTYEEMFNLINNKACALTKVDEATLTFNLIEEVKGHYV